MSKCSCSFFIWLCCLSRRSKFGWISFQPKSKYGISQMYLKNISDPDSLNGAYISHIWFVIMIKLTDSHTGYPKKYGHISRYVGYCKLSFSKFDLPVSFMIASLAPVPIKRFWKTLQCRRIIIKSADTRLFVLQLIHTNIAENKDAHSWPFVSRIMKSIGDRCISLTKVPVCRKVSLRWLPRGLCE